MFNFNKAMLQENNIMRKILLVVTTMVVVMFSTAAMAETKIGVIDLNKILLESPQLTTAKADLKKKFDGREKELLDAQKKFQGDIEGFNKNSTTMKEDAKKEAQDKIIGQQKKLQDLQTKFQNDLTTAQNDIMRDILKKVESIVNKTAEDKKLDLVITKISTAYNKKELEITDDVIKQMKK